MLGLGMALQLMFAIPFVGLLVMPIGVTAGTILYCHTDWERLARNGWQPPDGFVPPRLPS